MAVPSRPDRVAWYEFGARPGNPGNAVIAGHLDSKTGPAIFWRLKELKPGDDVYVSDDRGHVQTFRVASLRSFSSSPPIEVIFGQGERPLLNLITCAGPWNKQQHRYAQRLIVFSQAIP
jgi:LPXTG-site transpeptidase (sortase) family protein